MDRSVDSIGSCSLDVDADSTDFSDTSGELNFLTPISGKDITREFTAGIKERCMLPVINCQAVTSVLDPVTGHISTVLTTTTAANTQQQPLLGGGDSSPTAATNKKPSYLNLACCVNGYSNLTTYDSKLRQDINKSREVSPSRPIIATLHYNRTDSGAGGHLLTAPTLSYVSMNNTINNNNNNYSGSATGIGGNRMLKMNGAGVVNGGGAGVGGRMRGMNGSIISPPGGADMTDNAASIGLFNGNGSFVSSMRSKVISSQSQISSHAREDAQLMTPKKSFIQQRVEKLYGGAGEVVVLNKQNYSSSERKYLNNIANENNGGTPVKMAGQHQSIGNGTARNGGVTNGAGLHVTNGTNGSTFVDENNRQINGEGHGGEDADVDSLPVLRHLRPEFRAQLQIFSPKKVPKSSPNRTAVGGGVGGATHTPLNSNGNVTHANGNAAEENANLVHTATKRYAQSNGNSYTDHLEQLSLREEQMQDHRDSTHRSTMVLKTAQLASHTVRTTNTTNGGMLSSNGRRHTQEEDALTATNRHHSNASTRTAEVTHTDVIEQQQQQQQHEASQSYHSDSVSSSSVSSSTVIVETSKKRSLVVVSSSTSADGNGVGRMSTSDGSSATIATVTVPDEQQNTTTVATSVIANGEQNGAQLSNQHSNNNASEGLENNVPGAVTVPIGAVEKSERGEIVNCDSSNVQPVTADNSMRTANGSTTVLDSGAAVMKLPLTMAGVEHPDAEEDIQSSNKSASLIETTTNGSSTGNNNTTTDVLDGNHFLRILKTEQKRLRTMADVVEKEINQLKADGVVLGEDINGYILAAVGKARLLCSQKMKQFEDLCYTNLNQSPEEKFQTTGEDLRGFWDMVMLQVNNVDASFEEIDSFRKNGWRKPIPKSPPPAQARNGTAPRTKLVKRPYKTQTATASNGGATVTDGSNGVEAKKASAALAAAKREAQRKQLMEMKRKQKLANSQQQTAVEIFAPSSEEPAQNGADNMTSSTTGPSLVDTS